MNRIPCPVCGKRLKYEADTDRVARCRACGYSFPAPAKEPALAQAAGGDGADIHFALEPQREESLPLSLDATAPQPAVPTLPPAKRATPRVVEAALSRVVDGLIAKGFTFVAPDASPEEMQEQLARFDQGRLKIGSKVFGYALGLCEMPDLARKLVDNVIGFGTGAVDDAELAELQRFMRSSFALCAFSFSKLFGPRFVAILNGDDMTEDELTEALTRFEQINLAMQQLGGRLELKLFGRSVVGFDTSAATGSLIVVASDPARAAQVRAWVRARPLRNDTMTNQIGRLLSRWQFWVKLLVGMIEYYPHQLRQEVLVLDAASSETTSTAAPRLSPEFGFGLTDIAATGVLDGVRPPLPGGVVFGISLVIALVLGALVEVVTGESAGATFGNGPAIGLTIVAVAAVYFLLRNTVFRKEVDGAEGPNVLTPPGAR